jgi:hypothetical protein
MDSLITAAARALAKGDVLGALNRVALRDDAPALRFAASRWRSSAILFGRRRCCAVRRAPSVQERPWHLVVRRLLLIGRGRSSLRIGTDFALPSLKSSSLLRSPSLFVIQCCPVPRDQIIKVLKQAAVGFGDYGRTGTSAGGLTASIAHCPADRCIRTWAAITSIAVPPTNENNAWLNA